MRTSAALIPLAFAALAAVGSPFAADLAAAPIAVPPPSARVIDLTGTLSGATVARLDQELDAFAARRGSRIAVLMVPTTQPQDIARFAIRVADAWKLEGDGGDGAILIVAKHDRRVRLEIGRGLRAVLPRALARHIIGDTIDPRFRDGDFDGGVAAGVARMVAAVNGEALPPADRRWRRGAGGELRQLWPLLLAIALAAGILAFAASLWLARSRGWSNGGGWRGLGDRSAGDGGVGGASGRW
ncbi:MAG TPA: TPM domain-containing protein [Steroidobacteraceae bacterium]|nr:TPM domain-containing protein [Steroidobacteraceae bacterium]